MIRPRLFCCVGRLVRVIQVLKRLVNVVFNGEGPYLLRLTLEFCRILEGLPKDSEFFTKLVMMLVSLGYRY
jgi:hypothetical protein